MASSAFYFHLLPWQKAKGKEKNDCVLIDYLRSILCSKYQLQLTNEKISAPVDKWKETKRN